MASGEERKASFGEENQLLAIFTALNAQRSVSRFCDVILKVCDDQIFAHSNVLAATSPYFASFLGLGQDLPRAFSQKTPQIIEIHIDGSEGDSDYGDAVRKVVDYMYTSTINLNYNVLIPVLEIAKIMQMDKILEFCDLFQRGEDGVKSKGNSGSSLSKTRDANTQTKVTHGHRTNQDSYKIEELETPVKVKRKRGRPRKSEQILSIPEDIKAILDPKEDTASVPDETEEKKSDDKVDVKDDDIGEDVLSSSADELDEEEPPDQDYDYNEEEDPESTSDGRPIRRGKRPKFFENYVGSPMACYNTRKTKSGKEIYECQDCPYNSDSIYHFRRHRSSHMNESCKYKCDKCDFSSPRLKVLTNHHRNHLHEDNQCSFCAFRAEDMQELTTHLEKHTGQFPYFCNYCENKFKTRTQLNLHLPKHMDHKPFVCTECNAGFKWKHALKNHMIVHSRTKDHLCDICGFTTAHKSQLKAHRLYHTGNTFKCEIPGCTFQATKRQNLKYHMLTHTHEKPHQCEICGQSFSLVKNMKRHMLLHTDTRPYQCKVCIFTTTRYDKLKDHMLRQHGEGDSPKRRSKMYEGLNPGEIIEFDELNGDELSNIVHVENTMSTAHCKIEESDDGAQQIFITNPSGDPFPITLARLDNIDTSINSSCFQAIHLVTHVE